ncbi:MAG: sodium/proline symporter [Bacteroidales bacterium]|nr:sodium/proline symporter [Bacteroidales bacterium]
MSAEFQYIVVIVVYFAAILLFGLYQGRKVKTQSDFSIAGRSLPGWVAALSERSAGESSWALLGLPGYAYAVGLSSIWTAVGCVLGIVVAWWILAGRLRKEAEKYQAETYTDYLAKRFGKHASMLRLIAGVVIVFFFFFYVGAQFLGGGKTFNSLFHIDSSLGMIIIAAIIVPYAVYGGFKSVVYADVVQSIIMISILIFTPIVGIYQLLHADHVFATSISEALAKSGNTYLSWFGDPGQGVLWGTFIGGISWFFGYLGGQPQLSIRFMAIKDDKNAKIGRNVGIIWTIIAYIGALSIGWLGIAFFGPNGLNDSEQVMPSMLIQLFPPFLTAILTTGIIAAIMSTADSLLILSATELSETLIKPYFLKNKLKTLFVSRFVTVLIAVFALSAAFFAPTKLIYTLVGYVWAGIGGTFSVIILCALFWKRFHALAAIITIIVGISFTIIWISTGMEEVVTSRILTFFVAAITAIISTYIIKEKNKYETNIIKN